MAAPDSLTNRSAAVGRAQVLTGQVLLFVGFMMFAVPNAMRGQGLLDFWTTALFIVLGGFVSLGGGALMVRGRRHQTTDALTLLAERDEPPVVYLRAFEDEDRLAKQRTALVQGPGGLFLGVRGPEERLASVFDPIGPFVAIGKPGEELPELGAARLYCEDDQWQSVVLDLIRKAQLVVVRFGTRDGIRWELDEVREVPPERVLYIVEPHQREAFEDWLGVPIDPPQEAGRWMIRILPDGAPEVLPWKSKFGDPDESLRLTLLPWLEANGCETAPLNPFSWKRLALIVVATVVGWVVFMIAIVGFLVVFT